MIYLQQWEYRLASRLVQFFGLRNNSEFDTERAQAIVRVVVVCALGLYILPMAASSATPTGARWLFALYAFYIPFSFAIVAWVVRRPGVNPWRRALTISHDYASMTYGMIIGGAPLVPVFAIVVWVTVGNGLRYGGFYLRICTGLALISIAVVTYFNSYWRNNPYMVMTLVATALLVPMYIYVLLARLHRAYEAAQEASLAKSRFLAQASHDLRQPIHAISLFTACLRDAGLQPRELQMVDNIDRSLQSVSRLFKSLLDVSTLDSGKVVPKFEQVRICEVIDDVVRQNSEAAHRKGVLLQAVKCGETVEVDPALLTTILQNIVSNALKYAPEGNVLIGCRRRNGKLSLEVYDQGPGIAEEHRSRIFEEFYRVRERGDKDIDGVGLGLPIVKRLAQLMGLEVELRSEVGRGTCVAVSGMRIRAGAVAPAPAPAPKSASAATGLRVLLVEDDEDVLLATASLLRNWGCVVHAETAIPARKVSCDLLITDFDLGNKTTGTECIAKVREVNGWKVPAVIMSGHDDARIREEIADPEIPILSKPVRPAELRSVLLLTTLPTSS
ncbi:hybrid sensor histidine kinase/response regulator [Ancylobacter oerskovii]|uniref:histidine kinase n=1 Tax=Ancylobacter oerskovii TaxID=459519 RepID=A0ABW4Z6F0_9HYPH|nr:hybrid sensor histidine kinase/response regulator [Ancylobacter oerskovii]MBS7545541.1 response regulator [Ancylobacter oerskovii]